MSLPGPTSSWTAQSLEDWRARGRRISVEGNDIFVCDEGEPGLPVIVLIHGFPTSSWDWQGIWAGLRDRYRLVAMDMLGFGFSDKPNRRHYSIHRQADLVEAVIRECGLSHYHVLAHDYGDTVAQELLARQQEGRGAGRCLSSCFLNGGLFPETHRALFTQKLLLSPLGPLLSRLSGFGQFRKNFSRVFGPQSKPTEEELQLFWSLINERGGKRIFHNLITYMRDRRQHRERWLTVLQKSELPLALINGSLDPVSGEHMVARYQQLGCRLDYLARLPAIGHYPQVEDPASVLQHYLTFLKLHVESAVSPRA